MSTRELIDANALYWAFTGDGRIEFQMPGNAVLDMSASGPVDDAVDYWALTLPRPDSATVENVRAACAETGAWDDAELADDTSNWQRLLWILACDISEAIYQDDEYSADRLVESDEVSA